jgi:hypothetical protein
MFRFVAVILASLLLCSTAAANYLVGPITVTGTGSTPERARLAAFRLAIEGVAGVAINNELIAMNDQLIQKDTLHYSSGYIDRWEILKQSTNNNSTTVTLNAWVSTTRIRDRILTSSQPNLAGHLDGQRIYGQVETLVGERRDGNRMFDSVMRDSSKAFVVSLAGSYEFEFSRATNSGRLKVPFKITWNENYINALIDTLKVVYVRNPGSDYSIGFRKFGMLTTSLVDGFPRLDDEKYAALEERLFKDQIKITASLLDSENKPVFKACVSVPAVGTKRLWDRYDYRGVCNERQSTYYGGPLCTHEPKRGLYAYVNGEISSHFEMPVEYNSRLYNALNHTQQINFSAGCS